MDQKLKEKADKKVKGGWVRSTMMIEVLAATEETAKTSLEKHVENMGKEEGVILYKKEFSEIQKLEKPMKNVEVGYSNLVEVELAANSFDRLLIIVLNYAPSSIEILEPKELKIKLGEAQSILASVADLIHKYAAAGVGGVVIAS